MGDERMYVMSVVCLSTILSVLACFECCCTDDRWLVGWWVVVTMGLFWCSRLTLIEVNSIIRNSREYILA